MALLETLKHSFWARACAVSALALALSLLVINTEPFKKVSLQVSDIQALFLAPKTSFNDSLIVDIDEQSMQVLRAKQGEWPYNRDLYQRVNDFLRDAGSKAIVYDILFSEQRQGDAQFAASLARTPNSALPAAAVDDIERAPAYQARVRALGWEAQFNPPARQLKDITLPHELFTRDGQANIGVISVGPDPDGVVRRVPLLAQAYGAYLPTLPVAALFAGKPRPPVAYDARARELAIGDRIWPLASDAGVALQFPSNLGELEVLPFYHLVDALDDAAKRAEVQARVQGRRLFIGSSAAVLGDYVYTVHGRMPGLLVLGASSVMLDRGLVLKPNRWWWDLLLVSLAALLPLAAFRSQANPWLSVLTLAATVGSIIAISSLLYVRQQASALAAPLLIASMVYTMLLLLRLFLLFQEKQRLTMEKMAAERAYDLKSQFISQMTHELRTPLAAIMGFNKLLSESALTDRGREQYTRVISKNSDHLMTIINNMLDQSKLEFGQIKINPGPTPIKELLADVVDTLSSLAREKDLPLRADIDAALPSRLELDGFRLRQVLINLMGNAVKFTQRGRVELSAAWRDGSLELQVIDTGPGIPDGAIDRIFRPFMQGTDDTDRVFGGTGLGLSISRTLCQLMGGELQVSSSVGRGSTFTVRLPAPKLEDVAPSVPVAPRSEEQKLSGLVLLADDNADIRELLSRYLAKMGLSVVTAQDGAEAVAQALASTPDVVLMDMEMPIMRGNAAVRKLRSANFKQPILALTAHPEGPEVEQALRDGCDGYVAKPVNRGQLFATLQRLLEAGAQTRGRAAA